MFKYLNNKFNVNDSTNYVEELDGIKEMLNAGDLLAVSDMANILLEEWSIKSLKNPQAEAACYYLSHVILPTISGGKPTELPEQVKTNLNRQKAPQTAGEWLKLFPNAMLEAAIEYTGHTGTTTDVDYEHIEKYKEQNKGVFFTPNGITGSNVSPKGSTRLDSNVTHFNAFFVDFDGGDELKREHIEKIHSFPVFPSALVETKNGFHAYWLIKDDINIQTWKEVQKKLIKVLDSDESIINPSRLLRMPFSWHCKDINNKFLVKIIDGSFEKYQSKKIIEALDKKKQYKKYDSGQNLEKIASKLLYSISNLATPTPQRTGDISTPKPTELNKGERHSGLKQEAARLYSKISESAAPNARHLLKEWYKLSSRELKPNWEREVDDIADWMEQAEFGKVVSRGG